MEHEGCALVAADSGADVGAEVGPEVGPEVAADEPPGVNLIDFTAEF